MSFVWMDVTTISKWNRPAVGIIRVEAECAKYAIEKLDKDIKFCIYDSHKGYQEVNKETVTSYFSNFHKSSESKKIISNAHAKNDITLEQRLKGLFLKYNSKLPRRISSSFHSFLIRNKGAFTYFLASARNLKAGFSELLKTSKNKTSSIKSQSRDIKRTPPFSKNDTYLSLGLDWDQKDLTYLYSLKKELSLKIILFCYDIIPVKLPHLCVGNVSVAFRHYFSNVAWCADKILCISVCSKNDLHQLLLEMGTPLPELDVIQLGCDFPNLADDNKSVLPIELENEKFILYVSTIERRKNHETLYRAYVKLLDDGCENLPLLVFVGMPGWGVNDFLQDIVLDPRVKGRIRIYNNIDDSMLSLLYKECLFTVYPSVYEGWGLPISESLAYNKFCLASDAASIPEAGGDFIDYVYPWDVPGWAAALKKYIYNESLLSAKEKDIQHNYKINSWDSSARSIFEKVINIAK
ncbi:glycosyltransferase family 4 protein [Yersinia massiliensis]|uniref:glycosyltransferase family 4 protein n=1 Tax=Yersinia massiliensis TaxID=419257 RepID=UPI001CFCA421|nr:glycosyltransferase family 1 protein [Yersinia massiliensis]MCB5306751.1 glycosyltransferase family 4 protein [Yersinia massiliensis]